MKYIVGLEGCELQADEKSLLKKEAVGGVILYLKNALFAREQEFADYIQEIRDKAGHDIKMYVDEEGGLVSRLLRFSENWAPTYLAYLYETGGKNAQEKVRDYLMRKVESIHSLGVDVNLAPVVDYYPSVQEDSLGRGLGHGNPNSVVELARIWIEAHQEHGVESCLKHFPGLGRTAVDSHEELPVIDVGDDEWKKNEGFIFEELISSGVENVMVGHVQFSEIRKGEIASLSSHWIDRVRAMGKGFSVISDDLGMGALGGIEVTHKVLEDAGHDFVIVKDTKSSLVQEIADVAG